mmetsp:Transcript_113016/g.314532  ORF Transcript_113016/g.314532 Transcript_113016/m.314532 type:complete len:260 (+) Transcript_113016:798-1577(+)
MLLVRDNCLHDHVLVPLGAFYRALAENPGHHIQHCEVSKRNEHVEDRFDQPMQSVQWVYRILPSDAPRDTLEQCRHGPPQSAPIPANDVIRRGDSRAACGLLGQLTTSFIDQVLARHLGKENAKDVYEDTNQEHRPHQRLESGHDGVHKSAQCLDEAHQPRDARDPDQAGDAHNAEDSDVGHVRAPLQIWACYKQYYVHEHLPQRAQDNEDVQVIPGPVWRTKEVHPLCSEAQQQFQKEGHCIRVLDRTEGDRCLAHKI